MKANYIASDKSYDDSFSELFARLAPGLLVYARRFVTVQEVAEDIVSDLFVNFWEKRRSIQYDTAKPYLFKSTRNACLNYLTNLKIRTKYQNDILKINDLPDSLDTDHYVLADLESRIEKALDKLPPQQRIAFTMNRFEKKTYAEIAVEMNISPRTVDKHIEMAVKNLRRELAEYLHILIYLGIFI